MNKLFLPILVSLSLIATTFSCKKGTEEVVPSKPDSGNTTPDTKAGTPTDVGKSIGAMSSQTIGPTGGSLTTSDGKLTLSIPAGALTKETQISIEPVETTLPLGVGTSYHFMPEGTQFAKPATFTYHFTDEEVSGIDTEHLGLANQQTDHSWTLTRWATIDKTQKTITAKLPHFSWWTLVTQYELKAAKSELVPGETTTLHLNYSEEGFRKPKNDDDDLIVPIPVRFSSLRDIREWGVNGKLFSDPDVDGSLIIDPATSPLNIEYTAPRTLPAASNRIKAVYFQLETAGSAKLMLIASLRIVPAAELTVDGTTYSDVAVAYEYSAPHDNLGASYSVRLSTTNKSGKPIEVYLSIPNFQGAGRFTLQGNGYDESVHMTYEIYYKLGNDPQYSNLYWGSCNCEAGPLLVEPITVNITKLTDSGLTTEGTFAGTLHSDRKADKIVKLSARFRGVSQ
ncbi:hypothetical protein [Spirosoma endbachense]|uniref:ZU5 domain-containing protein n=1 Tax=Spirosoma endbachense TaxID=2666025 RepID=A0A6P1VSX1_9BACT|nr:hypothetical protein [Spirosoma endbachense]QHV95724.1 hypothetical protein GJR95_12200 [Spirosoma endbachense]